ncbi:hypothetical protein [Cytobacillus gottheilii]|uniref:hypothetical protein n=1 Tax=Cytobacillus gottheilii TaxID=859144 RepID=UPI0009BC7370|nr:hypothetical protein [Cytobacillus gottheilii]
MFISLIGLGQAGGNVCDLAAQRGMYTAAINFSQKDLDSLESVERKLKLVGSEGIGKRRENALELMNNNYDLMINFVKENFSHSSIEIIVVPFSTAGGSGAGIAPVFLSLLMNAMPEKVFVAMPILPDKKEVYTSQRNSLETFDDLSKLDILVLPLDNHKSRKITQSNSKATLYKKANEFVIDQFERINNYFELNSQYGIVDKRDVKNAFSQTGVATIGITDISKVSLNMDMSENGIANKIKGSWITSLFADIDMEKVTSAVFIFEGQERLMDSINLEKVFDGFKNRMPVNLYEGYYIGEGGTVLTILTGLRWCNSRLKEIDDILQDTTGILDAVSDNEKYEAISLRQSAPKQQVQSKSKVQDISSLIGQFKRTN